MNTLALDFSTKTATRQRAVVYRTKGRKHGPITRLMSPSDMGEILKPFVFLDHIDTEGLSRDKLPDLSDQVTKALNATQGKADPAKKTP